MFVLLTSFIIFSIYSINYPVSAKMYNCRIVNGVGDYGNSTQYYFITDSASGELDRINNSMNMWVHSNGTGRYTPISFRRTYGQSNSIIDFYKGAYYSPTTGYIAETKFFINSREVNPDSENWYWCKIELNAPVFDMGSLGDFHRTGTVSHEIGHAFGLMHPDEKIESVMLQVEQGRWVDGPQAFDFDEINVKY